jgi:hypothetical protein
MNRILKYVDVKRFKYEAQPFLAGVSAVVVFLRLSVAEFTPTLVTCRFHQHLCN